MNEEVHKEYILNFVFFRTCLENGALALELAHHPATWKPVWNCCSQSRWNAMCIDLSCLSTLETLLPTSKIGKSTSGERNRTNRKRQTSIWQKRSICGALSLPFSLPFSWLLLGSILAPKKPRLDSPLLHPKKTHPPSLLQFVKIHLFDA